MGVIRAIRGLADSGVTILLTTQYLEEADQLAARIAVIDHGRKIAEGTSRELKAATGSGFLHVALADFGGGHDGLFDDGEAQGERHGDAIAGSHAHASPHSLESNEIR